MKTKKKIDEFPHWAICRPCADKRGGIETTWAHTVHMGDCEYCDSKGVTMVPIRDFKWPKERVHIRQSQ